MGARGAPFRARAPRGMPRRRLSVALVGIGCETQTGSRIIARRGSGDAADHLRRSSATIADVVRAGKCSGTPSRRRAGSAGGFRTLIATGGPRNQCTLAITGAAVVVVAPRSHWLPDLEPKFLGRPGRIANHLLPPPSQVVVPIDLGNPDG